MLLISHSKKFRKAAFPFIRFCFFHLLSSPGPFTILLTVSDRTNVQCVFQRSHHFRRKNETDNSTIQGGLLDPWSPDIFVVEPRAESLPLLGARTNMLFLTKWSPGVKQWSPRALNFPSWNLGVQHFFFGRSPGALNPFETLSINNRSVS